MTVRAACACGAIYDLKDEYAGQRLACPRCGAAVETPVLPPPPPVRQQEGDSVFARDLFLLDQRHLAVNEKYSITDGEGVPLLFAERPARAILKSLAIVGGLFAGVLNYFLGLLLLGLTKDSGLPFPVLFAIAVWIRYGSLFVVVVAAMALSPKRHITVYRDDKRAEIVLTVTQDYRVPLLTALYTVHGADGAPLAKLYKKRLRNIFRKRWYCASLSGELLFMAREDSLILSILRRFLLGFFGLLRTNYVIYGRSGVAGEFNRRFTMLDRYVLDLSSDRLRSIDRRHALALGILLDTGEGR